MTMAPELQFSLLTEPIIRYRRAGDGQTVHATLPGLFVALAADEVRDYPALRPHQRHPWHAFLVQLAAIALHQAGTSAVFETEQAWRDALMALTPDDPDGAAWCLVSPPNRPALLQAPAPLEVVEKWEVTGAADMLDMLITSKNHDLKQERIRTGLAEDWLFSLVSLQTQEGFGGRDNFGITRMAGGFGSRTAVGAIPSGNVGNRWMRDISIMLKERARITDNYDYQHVNGISLVWSIPWDGTIATQISMQQLDPLYIEICRQVRLATKPMTKKIFAKKSSSKTSRISSGDRQGVTGDIWTSVNELAKPFGAALKIRARGFDYRLSSSLLFGIEYGSGANASFYSPTPALKLNSAMAGKLFSTVLCGVSRGGPTANKSVTQGYHERHIPISPKVGTLLISNQKAQLGIVASRRIAAISEIRKLLWFALAVLFANGVSGDSTDSNKAKASKFSAPFESAEDARFFDDLNEELEATDPTAHHLQWLLGLVGRAEAILKAAFDAGPRSGIQKYRAQSAALSRFHGKLGLRSDNFPIPDLVNHYRQQTIQRQEASRESA